MSEPTDDVMSRLRREIQDIEAERPACDPTPCGVCGCVIGAGLMLMHMDFMHSPSGPRGFERYGGGS